jgi:hypothetical protein
MTGFGHGIYFWESNPLRGYEFAAELKGKRQRIERPYVLGAVIDLGYCLDLLSTSGIEAAQAGYESFCQVIAASGAKLPVNSGGAGSLAPQVGLRSSQPHS